MLQTARVACSVSIASLLFASHQLDPDCPLKLQPRSCWPSRVPSAAFVALYASVLKVLIMERPKISIRRAVQKQRAQTGLETPRTEYEFCAAESVFNTTRRGHHAPPPAPWSDAAILCCSLHYSYFEPPRITLGSPSKGAAITWTEAWQKQRLWAKNGSKRRVAKFLTKDTDGSCVPRRITDAVGQRA